MSTAVDSANLILKLYETRREETMRKGRNFVFGLDLKSPEDVMNVMMGPDGAYLRMVLGYWDMAASFVTHGAIDSHMFNDANGEHFVAFSKVEPFLPALREGMMNPDFLKHLEKVCYDAPGGKERVAMIRERIRAMLAARAATKS